MPQDTRRTNELLEALLSRALTNEEIVDEIDGLIEDQIDEDIHLDYKHGDVLERGAETPPPQLLREYIGAFANSAGGILMVGIDEDNWQVTGCQAPGGGSLTNWASRSLTPIAGYLSPPPVPYEVPHPDGPVLIVAVARAPGLVPCFDRGDRRPLYHLRLDDQTLAADEYLVADLVLGRRQHAYLSIAEVEARTTYLKYDGKGFYDWQFFLRFVIENQGLAKAEHVSIGVVGMHNRCATETIAVSDYLQRHVDVQATKAQYREQPEVGLHLVEVADVPPFRLGVLDSNGHQSAAINSPFGWYIPYEWRAAIYITVEDTPPTWYQLSIEIDRALLKHLDAGNMVSSKGEFLHIDRVAAGRPIVGWVGENI